MAKTGKKMAAILLAVAMVVTFMPVFGTQTVYADVTPAALDPESITVQILDSSDTVAYPGDTVRISMTITNHISGSPMVWSKRPQTGAPSFTGYMKRVGETDTWYLDIPIQEGDQSGIWKLNSIRLVSTDGTEVWYINLGCDGSPEDHYVDLSKGNYEVNGTTPDIDPPFVDLTTVNLSSYAANNGDTITFSVAISDENVIVNPSIFLKDPNGEIIPWLALSFNDDTGKYEYKMPITSETAKGTWSIYAFFAIDNSGNDKYYYPDEGTTDFYVNDITHASVAAIPAKEYDGSRYAVKPVVVNGDKTLVDGTDYYLSYPECEGNIAPKDAGEYEVVLTGQGDYIGEIRKSFTILPASISGATVRGISAKTYTGKPITQTPVIKIGETTLKLGTDYKVEYKNNTNVGTASMTIIGTGNCTGIVEKTFKITPKKITPTVTLSASSYTWNGKVKKPAVTVKDGSTKLAASQYTVTYKNNKNVGTASAVVTLKGNYSGLKTEAFVINPKGTSLSKVTKAKKAVTVKWKKQSAKMSSSRITGYQIQLATDSKFTKNKKTVNVKGYSKTSKKVTKLKGGKKYYVRIRTYKTVGGTKYYSPWSKVKTVTTKK